MENTKKDFWKELLRFVICGIAAALTDYLLCQLSILKFNKATPNINNSLLIGITTAIGFIGGVVVNYFLSTYWVYQNVEKKENTKKFWFIALFTLFSLIAFFLSWGTMLLCDLFTTNVLHYSIADTSIFNLISQYRIGFLGQGIFWAYFISFILKTLVGLVFNYFTRKYILYKAPKNKEENIGK